MEKKELICDCNVIHKDVVDKALKNKPKDNELGNLSELFKILGDLTRIKILWTLDNIEMCVCDIANVLNMTKSSISHQLAILRTAGIVKYRKSGKEVYYMLDDNHIKKLYEIGIEHIEHKTNKGDYVE
jgi:ArsR family transcriptional regulator, lead/cadmium/zinc/bismuth-responsive transcriptional repressor